MLAAFDGTHVASLDPDALRGVLAACVGAFLDAGIDANVSNTDVVAERLAELRQ